MGRHLAETNVQLVEKEAWDAGTMGRVFGLIMYFVLDLGFVGYLQGLEVGSWKPVSEYTGMKVSGWNMY